MNLPPLNPLKAFEAAARLQSFQLAASELNVTPGAISRQVKALEDFVGFSLFNRIHNRVEVTREANTYYESIRAAFLLMEKSTLELVNNRREGPLRVWCSRLFMRHWLVPRLVQFHELFPSREVRLAGGRSSEPLPSDTDIAIRYGTEEDWAPWEAHFLMGTTISPVCTPAYAETHPPLREPADVLEHTLLFSATRLHDWDMWLAAAGLEDYQIKKKIILEGDGTTYRAASEGLGIAMERLELAERDLGAGRLFAPFPQRLNLDRSFYLIYPQSYRHPKKLIEFRDWMLKEAAQSYDWQKSSM